MSQSVISLIWRVDYRMIGALEVATRLAEAIISVVLSAAQPTIPHTYKIRQYLAILLIHYSFTSPVFSDVCKNRPGRSTTATAISWYVQIPCLNIGSNRSANSLLTAE
jgi:hypothetical protein